MGGGTGVESRGWQDYNQSQQPYFRQLWQQGANQVDQFNTGQLTSQANQLYGQGQQFLNQLGQGPGQYAPSQAANTQIQGLQQGIGQQANRMMAGVGQQGVQAGQFGGGRGEVGKGMVAEGAQNALVSGMGQIYGQDMNNQTAQYGIQQQAAMGGLNSLQGLQGVSQQGALSGFAPYMAQAGILGGPTVVGDSSSSAWNANAQVGGK